MKDIFVMKLEAKKTSDDHLLSRAVERFLVWEAELERLGELSEALKLSLEVVDPTIANATQCWANIWPKPLYANTKVRIGEKMIARLEPLMKESWRTWGVENGQLVVTHKGGSNSTDNFEISGEFKEAVKECRIAPHRLYAIQGAANFMRHIVAHGGEDKPLKTFSELPLEIQILWLQSLGGRGWGHISALHVLTDFGLAVKPDIHLARTIHALDFLPYVIDRASPQPLEAMAIVQGADALGRALYGGVYGSRERRYLDKVLMDVSRCGLL